MRNSQAENGAARKPELADRLEHLEERLRRQVLGVVTVADAHVQVAVDAVEVDEVQLFERVAVALLTALDESADVVAVRRRRDAPPPGFRSLQPSAAGCPGHATPNPTLASRRNLRR